MILEAAIINVTRNLDIVSQKETADVSSNTKLKEEGLSCLVQLIEKAPQVEYKKLIQSEHCDILIGYLFNVLSQLAKNDKSRKIRCQSLQVICSLVKRLDNFHDAVELGNRCCLSIVESALPGVSSVLFKLISSDVKLSRELLKTSIKTLGLFIASAIKPCKHRDLQNDIDNLKETCDNVAIRTSFMIDYIINNATQLHNEVKHEILNLCYKLVCHTRIELVERVIKSVVKYQAFLAPDESSDKELQHEIKLKNLLITNHMQAFIDRADTDTDTLETTIITSLLQVLDELDNDYLTMLHSERQGKLSILNGFLRLLPVRVITTFLQLSERRLQMLGILVKLAKFSTTQPFLFLTDVKIQSGALETNNDKIYTVEKLFAHLNHDEVLSVKKFCQFIAVNVKCITMVDFLHHAMMLEPVSNQLFINHMFIKGLLDRPIENGIARFTSQTIPMIVEYIQEMNNNLKTEDTDAETILRIVLSIETLVTLIELHVKNSKLPKEKFILLRITLCPLLNLASSNYRSVSEATLSGLAKISQVYEYDSTKSLIESNIDYIVNGVMQLLDSYLANPEVTNILALTFKLSSIQNFYFFKDVYERVFKILGSCHHKCQTQSIALLFYRTLSIMKDWNESNKNLDNNASLDDRTVKLILSDLSINRRVVSLRIGFEELETQSIKMDEILNKEVSEKDIIEEIKSRQHTDATNHSNEEPEELSRNEKSTQIIFTEKIVTLCVHLMSSDDHDTKVLALKAASCGLSILQEEENTLLPLVHQIWSPLLSRLTSGDYKQDLEVNMCAFECLVTMAKCAKDFIKSRLLDSVMPRLCLFLDTQASLSKGQKDYGPYSMTMAFKCQLAILSHLGSLAYHTEMAYTSLWGIIRSLLIYLSDDQLSTLKQAAACSLRFLMILDPDCVWYFAKQKNCLEYLPFDLIYNNV